MIPTGVTQIERRTGPRHRKPYDQSMLAREKWMVKTLRVLDMVFDERVAQTKKHGDAMSYLPDGTGPDVMWAWPLDEAGAAEIQTDFRRDYETRRADVSECDSNCGPVGHVTGCAAQFGQLTKMHLVREELAEMFELDANSPEFIAEALQVAALCVQWVEEKLP